MVIGIDDSLVHLCGLENLDRQLHCPTRQREVEATMLLSPHAVQILLTKNSCMIYPGNRALYSVLMLGIVLFKHQEGRYLQSTRLQKIQIWFY